MSEFKDIFISFSNKNVDKVEKIVNTIKFYGVDCWFQKRDSKQNYVEEINKGINNSNNFVVFLSNDSIQSLMVKNEITRAISQQKKNPKYAIIPVVIEDISEENQNIIELLVGSLNWLNDKDYDTNEALVLAIFEQANISLSDEEGTRSIYSTESNAEKRRLKIQNDLYNRYAKKYLDDIFSNYDNPTVLDIGCNNGDNIMNRLEGYKYSFLLGVDNDSDAIKEANKLYAQDNRAFIECDITSDSFLRELFSQMQKKKISGFDIIHISDVLMHLENSETLLNHLYIVLNSGGKIFVQEEDDGVNTVYPHSKFFDNVFYIWEHSKESGNRKMGRKVPLALKKAGFKSIQLLSTTITSIDFDGKYKEELWDLYFNPELWCTDSAEYFDTYEAFNLLKVVSQKHDETKEDYMNGKYFIALGLFFLVASKE